MAYKGINNAQTRRKKKKQVAQHFYGVETSGLSVYGFFAPCYFCKVDFRVSDMTLEHLIPVSRDGARTSLDNLENACTKCNGLKGDLTVDEFIVKFGKPSYLYPRRGILTGEA